MAKHSPLQRTQAEHGSKDELAKKVLAFLDVPEDEDKADFEHRIGTLSNKKLLRLYDAHEAIGKLGGKDAVVEKVTKARFNGGNADYAAKISGFTEPKLLDLARQFKIK